MRTDRTEYITDFELVWKDYPRKVGKGAARKVWKRLAPDTELVQKMIDAIKWQRTQPQWLKDAGAFIPHLATWLNQERWDDEPYQKPAATRVLSPEAAAQLEQRQRPTFAEEMDRVRREIQESVKAEIRH